MAAGGRVGDERGGDWKADGHFALADGAGEPGGAGANAAGLPGESIVLLRWARDLPPIIKLSNAASNGRWPTARWRHSMTGPDRARSRPSRARGEGLAGVCGVRQGQGARL